MCSDLFLLPHVLLRQSPRFSVSTMFARSVGSPYRITGNYCPAFSPDGPILTPLGVGSWDMPFSESCGFQIRVVVLLEFRPLNLACATTKTIHSPQAETASCALWTRISGPRLWRSGKTCIFFLGTSWFPAFEPLYSTSAEANYSLSDSAEDSSGSQWLLWTRPCPKVSAKSDYRAHVSPREEGWETSQRTG